MTRNQKGWVMTKAFHPTKYEKRVYVVDFWKKGTTKVDRNLKRYQVKSKTRAGAIRKAKIKLQQDIR